MTKNNFIRFLLILSFGILVNFSLAEEVILGNDQLISKPALNIEVEKTTNDVQVVPKTPEIKSASPLQQNLPKTTEVKLNLPRRIILIDKVNFKIGESIRLNIEDNFLERLNNAEIKMPLKKIINSKQLKEGNNFQDLTPHLFQNFGFSLF